MSTEPQQSTRTDAALVSKLMFEAREQIDMYADHLYMNFGHKAAGHAWRVRDAIDAYRAERGWAKDGYGGEHA